MVNKCDVLVIGSGPAGIMASILASKKRRVVLIEKPSKEFKLAKRILVSGNGRANFFNEDLLSPFGMYEPLLRDDKHDYAKELLSYLNDNGFAYTNEGKLYYPYFKRSECLHNFLLNRLDSVSVIAGKALSIDKDKQEVTVLIDGQKKIYQYNSLVLAIGARSYDRNDFTYDLIDDLDVKYKSFKPMLCPIKVKEKIPSYLEKNRLSINLSLYQDNHMIYQEEGEVIFKKDGISGICVFNSTIPLLDGLEKNRNSNFIYKLDYAFNLDKKADLSCFPLFLQTYIKEKKLKVGEPLIFNFLDFYDFKDSQASYGGILLSEINLQTLSLKKHENIYVLGEMLNVNLPCGGYNIGTALIEGYRVGKMLGE